MLTPKNTQATAVLAGLIWRLSDEQREMIHVEPYLNGREDGFAVQVGIKKKAVFSEYRRSDSIVIYLGDTIDFSMQGNTPNEKTYENKRFVDFLEIKQAVELIKKFLFDEMKSPERLL